MAVVVQAKARRQAQRPIRRQVPCNNWCQVMRRIMQAETVAVAEPAVHLNSGDKILAAETTALCRGLQCQGTAGAQGIAELPRIAAGKVLSSDGVFNQVPSLEGLRKQQLKFQFVIMFFL